jgi:hypothetical protein
MRDGQNVRPRHPSQSVRTVIEFDRGRGASRLPPPAEHLLSTRTGAGEGRPRAPIDTETRPMSGEIEQPGDDAWAHRAASSQRALTHSVALPIVSSSADLPTRELPADPAPSPSDVSSRDERDARWPLPSERVALSRAAWADEEAQPPAVATAPARTVVVAGATSAVPPPLPNASAALQLPPPPPVPARTSAAAPTGGARSRFVAPIVTFVLGVAFAVPYGGELRASLSRVVALVQPANGASPGSEPEVSVVPATTTQVPSTLSSAVAVSSSQSHRDAALRPEQALTLYADGQRKEALVLYRRLARAFPEARVYAEVARILERELESACVQAQPGGSGACPEP